MQFRLFRKAVNSRILQSFTFCFYNPGRRMPQILPVFSTKALCIACLCHCRLSFLLWMKHTKTVDLLTENAYQHPESAAEIKIYLYIVFHCPFFCKVLLWFLISISCHFLKVSTNDSNLIYNLAWNNFSKE